MIAAFSPDDIAHHFHVMGSTMFVSSLWILATSDLYEIRHHIGKARHIFIQAILQVPIFIYAGAYFFNKVPYDSIMQKIALLSLGVVLIYATKKLEQTDLK